MVHRESWEIIVVCKEMPLLMVIEHKPLIWCRFYQDIRDIGIRSQNFLRGKDGIASWNCSYIASDYEWA